MPASRFAVPSGAPLPDYLPPKADQPSAEAPDLDVLFVGINPGRRSAETGHHYAGRGNHFWPLLYESGLVPEPLTHEDDWQVPEFGIGLTNLVARASPTMDDLSLQEMREGAALLREKILRYEPRIVCFNGKRIFEVFAGRRCRLGPQPERVGRSRLFVMPSTSARTASYKREDKLAYFRQLRDLLRMGEES